MGISSVKMSTPAKSLAISRICDNLSLIVWAPRVAAVQQDPAVDPSAFVDLRLLRPGYDVPRRQLHHVGGVPLHEPLALRVEQVRALAPGALGDEHAAAGQRGGMVLDHLHVHQGCPGAVGERHAVPGADERVGARLEDAPEAAGGDDDRLGADHVDAARPDVQQYGAAALPVPDDQGQHEPFLVDAHARLHHLLVQHVEQRLPGEVGDEEGPGLPLSAKGAGPEAAALVAVEDHPHVLHGDDLVARLAAHHLHGVLVREVVTALYRVVGVILPRVAAVGQRRVDAALRGVGVAADRVYLGDHGDVHTVLPGSQGRSHAREPGADYQHVVVVHLPRRLHEKPAGIYQKAGLPVKDRAPSPPTPSFQ